MPTKSPINPVNAQRWVLALSSVPIALVAIPLVLTRLAESYGPRARSTCAGWCSLPAPRSGSCGG